MSGDLDPLPGDPAALGSSASRLGSAAAGLRAQRSAFHDGSATVTVAVLDSGSALRLTALHDALRGVEAEYDRVERAGARVAGLLEGHARAWRRVEDLLDDLREEVRRAEREAHDAATEHARERARRTRQEAHEHGHAAKQALLRAREGLVGEVRSVIVGFDPAWSEAPAAAIRRAALGSPTAAAARHLAAGTLGVDEAWAVLDDAYGEVADDDSRASRSGATYQVLGGLDEFQHLLVGSVTDTGQMLAHPIDALEGAWGLLRSFGTHPARTSKAVTSAIVDPFVEEWEAGEQGRAVGRGLEAAFEVVLGTKGSVKAGRAVRESEALVRLEDAAARFRRLRAARRLRRVGTRVGSSSTWAFASERAAAQAMGNPVPQTTYRVHHKGLPTDYVFGNHGELVVVRGPVTLLRKDMPVVTSEAREMVKRLEANGWKKLPRIDGGRRWKNEPGRERESARLPAFDASGAPSTYREFDIDRPPRDGGRGLLRIVRDDENRVWYTDDHYRTFVRMK